MFRVFVCFSHEDESLVEEIVRIIQENGILPLWDRKFAEGMGFPDQIKRYIAHAHLFLPVITKAADEHKWVHQEIGYAMALNIPVLPISVGKLPGEMIQGIQAISLSDKPTDFELKRLKERLSVLEIDKVVMRYRRVESATFQCALLTEDRAKMLADYCEDVLALGGHHYVRQKGGLSSFHIPNQLPGHPVWEERYGGQKPNEYHVRVLREERLALEEHAKVAGCRLIVNLNVPYDTIWSVGARVTRLTSLLQFLESMNDSKCEVAVHPNMDLSESLTILGDWFLAESTTGKAQQGFRQTIFTRHAPSMTGRIEQFDREFRQHLETLGWSPQASRQRTMDAIRDLITQVVAPD